MRPSLLDTWPYLMGIRFIVIKEITIEETAPHSPGVYIGEVVRTHQSATGETLWEVEYEADGHRQFLDSEEMSNFGIKMIHGSVETRENITSAIVGVDPLSMQDHDIYHTKAGDTFVDVCKAVGVVDTNRKYYYDWLCQFHDYGARGCAYRFPSPFTSRGRLSSTAAVLEASKAFPVLAGSQWEHIMELHGAESARVNPSLHSAQAVRIGLASAEMNITLHRLADRSTENDAVNQSPTVVENNGGGRLSEEARSEMSSDLANVLETCGVHSTSEQGVEVQSAVDERIAQLENKCDNWRECQNPWKSRHVQDLVRNNEYLRNGTKTEWNPGIGPPVCVVLQSSIPASVHTSIPTCCSSSVHPHCVQSNAPLSRHCPLAIRTSGSPLAIIDAATIP
eukprot:SAG11_NODE_304_length_10999_cov_3.121376_6_plen_394_part_00